MAWLTSSPIYHHAEFRRSALKDVGINTGEPQNSGALELRSLGMGGVADAKIHALPSNLVVLRQKNVYINRKELPKLGSAGAHSVGVVGA